MSINFTDEQWHAYNNYADEVVIHVKGVDYPGEPAEEEWLIHTLTEGRWEMDWLIRQVEAVGTRKDGEPVFALTATRSKHEWGASAASLTLVMEVAHDALVAGGVLLLQSLAKAMAARLRVAGKLSVSPMTEEEATARVAWLLFQRFGEEQSGLDPLSVSISDADADATVTMRGAAFDYTVELRVEEGLVLVARVTKGRRA